MRFPIERYWSGEPLPREHASWIDVVRAGDELLVTHEGPYFGDPPPSAAVGPTPRLWEHEVLELFLAGDGDRYLELELGPHGHHLVIVLYGVRTPVQQLLPIDYQARIMGTRHSGSARVPAAYLPAPITRANAYAIHGPPHARCYHAHAPVPGDAPNFHQLDRFVACRI